MNKGNKQILASGYICFAILFFIFISGACFAFDIQKESESSIRAFVVSQKPEWKNEKININLNGNENIFNNLSNEDVVSIKIPQAFRLTKITPKMLVPVVFGLSNKNSRSANLWVRVELYKDVVIAREKIRKGSIISQESVTVSNREVALMPDTYFEDIKEVSGKMAKSTINAGSIINIWMLKLQPVISKGSKIKVSVTGSNIVIETEGIALEDGQIGDKIKVRRSDSGKTFDAIVINSESVEVKI